MSHHRSDLTIEWKIHVPAVIAGRVEHLLLDSNGKTKYGARSALLVDLLTWWIAREGGEAEPHVKSLSELLMMRRPV